jgi:hypothetical protein
VFNDLSMVFFIEKRNLAVSLFHGHPVEISCKLKEGGDLEIASIN